MNRPAKEPVSLDPNAIRFLGEKFGGTENPRDPSCFCQSIKIAPFRFIDYAAEGMDGPYLINQLQLSSEGYALDGKMPVEVKRLMDQIEAVRALMEKRNYEFSVPAEGDYESYVFHVTRPTPVGELAAEVEYLLGQFTEDYQEILRSCENSVQ